MSGFEKGPTSRWGQILFLIAHTCIFKAVISTGLKPGIAILHYTHYKFHATSTSGLGVAIASVTCGWNLGVLCLTLDGAPLFQVRRELHFLMLALFSRRAGVPINQDWRQCCIVCPTTLVKYVMIFSQIDLKFTDLAWWLDICHGLWTLHAGSTETSYTCCLH